MSFISYLQFYLFSQTAKHDSAADIRIESTGRPSLSAESIVEDLPEKSVSEDDTTVHDDDTTVHDESENDTRDASPRVPHGKVHDSGMNEEYNHSMPNNNHTTPC